MMDRSIRGRWRQWRERRRPRAGWPSDREDERPRVLLEYPSFGTPSVVADVLQRAGYEPLVCDSPGDMVGVCHLLNSGECALARDADVVFNGFGLGTEEHREIIDELRRRYPDTPLVVETTRQAADRHADVLRDCQRCDAPLTSRRLLTSLSTALARR